MEVRETEMTLNTGNSSLFPPKSPGVLKHSPEKVVQILTGRS